MQPEKLSPSSASGAEAWADLGNICLYSSLVIPINHLFQMLSTTWERYLLLGNLNVTDVLFEYSFKMDSMSIPSKTSNGIP